MSENTYSNEAVDIFKITKKLVQVMDLAANDLLPNEIVDVVKLHSKLSVGSAWIPIPGVDIAAGAASIWGMYLRINDKLGLSFGENAMKTIGSGVATNLASYAAMSGVASALKFIPGIGTLGSAVIMSGTLYAITLASGYVYLRALCYVREHFGANFSASELSEAVTYILKDRQTIKGIIESAKRDYSD